MTARLSSVSAALSVGASGDYLRQLDQALNAIWKLGRNLIVGWRPAPHGIDLLVLPQFMLPSLIDAHAEILSESHQLGDAQFDRLATHGGIEPTAIELPSAPLGGVAASTEIDTLVRRYSVTKSEHRAAILFDIVGFSLHSPLEQVTLLNSLSYSINVAQSKAMAYDLPIDLGRSTTGDGFYVWNRDTGIEADVNLFYLMMLILADNALAMAKGRPNTTPVLRTSFHIGSHYEYYQADGLNPSMNGFIVGDLTITLARMVQKALAGQILIGSFERPDDSGAGSPTPMATTSFMGRAQEQLDRLMDVTLAGEQISAIKAYLTGERLDSQSFNVKSYRVSDKHGHRRTVFNAKVSIYRGHAAPLYLGLGNTDLQTFDAEPAA